MRTRYGSKVFPLSVPDSEGWIKVRREEDNAEREWNVRDLCADTEDEARFLSGQTRILKGALGDHA